MKFFALLMVVGLAAASGLSGERGMRFESGKEFTFEYSGRLMTGIPALSNQYSGLGINATVSLIARTPTTLGMIVSQPKFVKINDVLEPVEDNVPSTYDGTNWRRVKLPEMMEVPEEFKRILSLPVIVELDGQTGEVSKVTISKREPEWSVNLKKGIVSLFQVKMESGINTNMIQNSEQTYWKVMEETVSGKCLTTYQVNELPEFMIRENPSMVPVPEACQTRKYFEVVRSVDFNNCQKQSSFSFYRPGHFMKKGSSESINNIGSMLSRSSTTRFVACGSGSNGQMTIQTIVNDGEFDFQLMGTKTERLVSGSLQTLRLKSVKPMSTMPQPSEPVTLQTMMYEYTEKAYGLPSVSSNSVSEQILTEGRIPRSEVTEGKVLAKAIPRTFFQGLNSETTPNKSEFVTEIARILKEVMMTIRGEGHQSLVEAEVNQMLVTAVRGMTALETVEEIERLYTTVLTGLTGEQTQTVKQLFLDTVVMTGTPHSIEFFGKMVREGKVPRSEINAFFMFLPRYVMVPTEQVLNRLFKLVTESETIKSVPTTYSVAMTGLTQLVQSACISEDRKTSFPTYTFGEFCTPESEIVQEVLIPYLARYLHKEPQNQMEENIRNVHIISLGLLRHKNVITELTPIIEAHGSSLSSGSISLDSVQGSRNSVSRVLAVYSMMNAGFHNPGLVTPVLLTVFTNPAESTEMRIAAFNALVKLNPPKYVFDTIASVTRQEPKMDMELLKVINIGLYTLGHEAEMFERFEQIPESLSLKAKSAYHMIKKTYGIVPTTANFYKTEFLRELNSGYKAQLTWVAAHEQIMPRSGYFGITLFLQQHYYDLFQGGFMMSGTDSVIDRLSSVVSKIAGGSSASSEDLKSEIRRSLDTEFAKVLEKLNVKPVEESKVLSANAFFQMGETGIIFRSISERASDLINEKIVNLIQNPSSLLSGQTEMKVNFQKTIDLSPIQIMFPSDMGLPVQVELNAPVTVSLMGKASVEPRSMLPSITLSGKALMTTQFSGVVGTICPFTREFVVSGINQHSAINIPGSMEINLDVPSQKLSVFVRPSTQEGHEVTLGHYQIMPYTTVGQINKLQPLTKTAAMKPIRSGAERKERHLSFGEFFGLGLKTQMETESRFVDARSILELVQIYKNPINMMMFGWTSPALSENLVPSVRYHKMTTLFRPDQSSTKEIGIEVKIGAATKVSGQSGINYHTLSKKSISSLSQDEVHEIKTNPTLKKLLLAISPLKVESQTLGSQTHERRQLSLKEVISQLESSKVVEGDVTGLTLTTSLILKSTRPRTFTYSMTAALGSRNSESKKIHHEWNVQLESQVPQTQLKKVSVRGKLTLPVLPMWNIDQIRQSLINFDYENKMAFTMANGQESQVITTGSAKTSEEQKAFSTISSEAKQLKSLVAEGQTSSKLISELKEIVRIQASTLDKVIIESEYINFPKGFEIVQSKIMSFLKAYLWPYYCPSSSTSVESTSQSSSAEARRYKSTVQLSFRQQTPSFDLEIVRPNEKVFFRNVRVSYPYNLFFPLTAAKNNVRLATNKIVSGSVSRQTEECWVNGFNLWKFNGEHLDMPNAKVGSEFLIAADVTQYHSFGVLVKRTADHKRWSTKIVLKKNIIEIIPERGHYNIFVNGKPFQLPLTATMTRPFPLADSDERIFAHIYTSGGTSIYVQAPKYNLNEIGVGGDDLDDTQTIAVVPSLQIINKMMGLCGNLQKPIMSQTVTSQCVYSKPELEVAAWTIPSVSSSVPSHLMSELKKETEMCSKVMVQPTKVAKAYKAATGRCTILKHLTMMQPGKMCISKVPVTQCGPSCKSQESQMTEKSVEFTCMPRGRMAEHYMAKVQKGESIPELKDMEVSFETVMRQPSHCVHALVSSGVSRGPPWCPRC